MRPATQGPAQEVSIFCKLDQCCAASDCIICTSNVAVHDQAFIRPCYLSTRSALHTAPSCTGAVIKWQSVSNADPQQNPKESLDRRHLELQHTKVIIQQMLIRCTSSEEKQFAEVFAVFAGD